MVIDKIENAALYYNMGDRVEKALRFLQQADLSQTQKGRYEIDGDELFYILQEYSTKAPEDGKWEAHRKYIDIQFVISGAEKMGAAHISGFGQAADYNEDSDMQILKGDGDFFKMSAGSFAILYPWDVHMPGIRLAESIPVRKAVVKVKL